MRARRPSPRGTCRSRSSRAAWMGWPRSRAARPVAQFDLIVVGGGAVGTSALHHLMAGGAKSALLLERLDGYGRGATGIWGSLVRMFYEKRDTTESACRSVPFYVGFEREVGVACPWNR